MMEEHKKLFSEYLEEAKLAGHREQGLIGLRSRVPKVLEYLEEMDLAVEQLGVKQAQAFQGRLIEKGRRDGSKYSNASILAYVKAAANFYEYLKRKGTVLSNPFKEIKRVRVEKKLPRNLLKEKEMNSLLEELARYDEEGNLRNKMTRYKVHVICELMYSTALRVSEVASLRAEDIDFSRGLVTVREGKGGRSRIAYLNEYAKEVLKCYMEKMRPLVFRKWNKNNHDLLFGVGWMSFSKMLNKTLNKTAEKLKYGGFTSHGFRHAVGYHLLRAGCNIRHIQEILGHKLLRNTEIYTRVDKEDLKEVLDRYHPRKWKRVRDEEA